MLFGLLALYLLFFATHYTFRFQQLRFLDQYRYHANCWSAGTWGCCDDRGTPIECVDCARYKNVSYPPYAPLPAVLQFFSHNVAKLNIPTPVFVYLLAVGMLYALFWTAVLYFRRVHDFDEAYPVWAALAVCITAGLSDRLLHTVVTAYAWSQAITAGQFCLVLSIFFVVRYCSNAKTLDAAAAGLCAGCALLSKQNYAPNWIPTLLFIVFISRRLGLNGRRSVKNALAFTAPVVLCICTLFAWNYARFGSPFESGVAWVNASESDPSNFQYPRLHRLPYTFYNHFLAPLRIGVDDFPFLRGQSSNFGPINRADGSGGLLHNTVMFSFFIAMPLLLAAPIGAGYSLWRIAVRHSWADRDLWWIYLFLLGASVFFTYFFLDSAWARYQYDLIGPWSLVAVSAVIVAMRRLRRHARMLFLCMAGLALGWESVIALDQTLGLFFSRDRQFIYWNAVARPENEALRERAGILRSALFDRHPPVNVTSADFPANRNGVSINSRWHVPASGAAFLYNGYKWTTVSAPGAFRAKLRFPNFQAGAEPLVAVGTDRNHAGLIGVRFAGALLTQLFIENFGAERCDGMVIAMVPGRAYDLEFWNVPDPHRATLRLDGTTVLSCNVPWDAPAAGIRSLGTNFFGFAGVASRFSGEIAPDPLP